VTRSAGSRPTWRKSAFRARQPINFSSGEVRDDRRRQNGIGVLVHRKNIWHCAHTLKLSLSFLDHYWHCPSSCGH
jgi:hypothetical protein